MPLLLLLLLLLLLWPLVPLPAQTRSSSTAPPGL
jgi:hypothetical protein